MAKQSQVEMPKFDFVMWMVLIGLILLMIGMLVGSAIHG